MKQSIRLTIFIAIVLFGFALSRSVIDNVTSNKSLMELNINAFSNAYAQPPLPCWEGTKTFPQSAEIGSFQLWCDATPCYYCWIDVTVQDNCPYGNQ